MAVTYFNEAVPVKISVYNAEGSLEAESSRVSEDGRIRMTLENPVLWNAEEPYLYKVVLEAAGEVITDRMGIREICTRDGVVYINGVKVKFHGTNRHDSDPVTGFAISLEQMKKDLQLMKEHNINCIRTSYYPNAPQFYQLCDELSCFVIDEADNEATEPLFSIWKMIPGRRGLPDGIRPLRITLHLQEATVDRTQRCVQG